MRKFICILAVLSYFGIQAHTQEDNFFVDGKYWIIEREYLYQDKWRTYKFSIDDEVEIDGITARRLRREWLDTGESELTNIGYEKDGVVFIYHEDDDNDEYAGFFPILDFNAKVGDQLIKREEEYPFWDNWNEEYATIEDEGYLTINGKNRRIQYLNKSKDPSSAWIDGIGVSKYIGDVLLIFNIPSCICDELYSDSVIGCYIDDECLYQASDLNKYLGLSPDLGALDGIAADGGQDGDEPLYDLMGRKVASPQPGRIYVSPSGKRVWR